MTFINDRFAGFVRWVVTRGTGETAVALSPRDRDRLIDVLEQCVSHKLLLKRYLRVLQTALNGRARCNGSITIARGKQLADEGLGILDDSELICLALDPVSMWTLHDLIDEEFPDRWIERVIEADKKREAIKTEGHESSQPCEDFAWDEMDLVSEKVVTRLLGSSDSTMGGAERATYDVQHATTASHRPLQPTYGLELAAQSPTAEKSSQDDIAETTRVSRYRLVDENDAAFALKTDREGCVFVVLSAQMLNQAPRSVVVNGETYTLNPANDQAYEIENLGKGDLRDLADREFIVKGTWQS